MTSLEDKGDIAKAKSAALRLVKFRARSEKEIRDKLTSKSFDPAVIDQVITSLKESRIIDDDLFARLWVESRIKKPLGIGRLRQELRRKGIEGAIIEKVLERARENYDEDAVIRGIIGRRSRQMADLPADKAKARLFGYLVRRGYPKDRVMEAIIDELG